MLNNLLLFPCNRRIRYWSPRQEPNTTALLAAMRRKVTRTSNPTTAQAPSPCGEGWDEVKGPIENWFRYQSAPLSNGNWTTLSGGLQIPPSTQTNFSGAEGILRRELALLTSNFTNNRRKPAAFSSGLTNKKVKIKTY